MSKRLKEYALIYGTIVLGFTIVSDPDTTGVVWWSVVFGLMLTAFILLINPPE